MSKIAKNNLKPHVFRSSQAKKSSLSFFRLFNDLNSDIKRYKTSSNLPSLLLILCAKGLWVTFQYRISKWIDLNIHLFVIRQILKLCCFIWQKMIEITTGCELSNRAQIGKGIYITHTFGIVIHGDAKIGDYCNIGHGTTIGLGGRGDKSGVPKIGDRVFIGPGAKIFGAITIGNDVAIGANAVVTKNLPDKAVAVGVPAIIISYQGSQDFISM